MNWYLVPMCVGTLWENEVYCIGTGLPGSVVPVYNLTEFILHCAVPKVAPESALVGFRQPRSPVPAGWTAQTLDEAKACFESVYGRAPSVLEVY